MTAGDRRADDQPSATQEPPSFITGTRTVADITVIGAVASCYHPDCERPSPMVRDATCGVRKEPANWLAFEGVSEGVPSTTHLSRKKISRRRRVQMAVNRLAES